MNESLALTAAGVVAASGFVSLLFGSRSRVADGVWAALVVVGSACGIAAAFRAITSGFTGPLLVPWRVPGGEIAIEVDALSAMFLAQIFAIGALGAVYGIGYWPAPKHPESAAKVRAFYGLVVAAMAVLVVARNSILFLASWEVMTISAFFLVTAEHRERAVQESGYVYLVATRFGTLCLIAMFVFLRHVTGSFSLSGVTLHGTGLGTAIFVLALIGFGLKAGLMPLHIWLPGAHANAPTHVSAMMSGVLIKTGIYGLFRISAMFEQPPLAWGLTTFALGVVSAVLGVAFAIGQHDIKRLLAYHSVENIGIIVMGLGLGLIGKAMNQPVIATLGLAGALLHVWNHGLFKALLFFAAGSVVHATHTREIDALGGLSKRMPRTSLAFLVGAVAISGLPPLNGFVSEVLIYVGMLKTGISHLGLVGVAVVLGASALALVGALAVACFVKVFGTVFLGEPRSKHGRNAVESSWWMLGPMAVLAFACAFIGAAPPLVAPVLERASRAYWVDAAREPLGTLAPLGPVAWTNALLVILLCVVGFVLRRATRSATRSVTWDCGYAAPSPKMQYTASSFGDWLVSLFGFALRPRVHAPKLSEPFPGPARFESHVPEVVLDLGVMPLGRQLARFAARLRWLQQGNLQLYLLYVLATLVLMLLIWR